MPPKTQCLSWPNERLCVVSRQEKCCLFAFAGSGRLCLIHYFDRLQTVKQAARSLVVREREAA